MLRITIELWPYGLEKNKKVIGVADVYNDGSGTVTTGNYGARIYKKGSFTTIWKKGETKGFPRRRLGPWDLLLRILINIVGDRN
jgi:hypothetical protein